MSAHSTRVQLGFLSLIVAMEGWRVRPNTFKVFFFLAPLLIFLLFCFPIIRLGQLLLTSRRHRKNCEKEDCCLSVCHGGWDAARS